jgi:DNA modification methylase
MSEKPTIANALSDLPHVSILALEPFQGGLKELTAREYGKLKKSLLENGVIVPFFVWAETGKLLDGHQRRRVFESEGWQMDVPVVYISAENEQDAKRKLLVISSQYGKVTQEGFDEFTFDLDGDWILGTANFDALPFVFDGLADEPEPEDAEPQINRADELQQEWGTELGQLWRLPSRTEGQEHRLICGDCTDAAVVERVMGGEKAEMVWTDPPYGVAVGDKNKYLNSIARSNRVEENLQNDTLGEPELLEMLRGAFGRAKDNCTAGAAWHVAAPAGPLHVLFGQLLKDMGVWRQTIQWVKNNATFSPLGVDYHWRAEPIFYGWLPNGAHRYYGGRKQTTVWEIDRPSKSPEHPTMKPVELVQRAVANHTLESDIVLDSFSGSGTTLIAAENLSRQCRAVEISPAYVAVALQRYKDAFGIEPELIQ